MNVYIVYASDAEDYEIEAIYLNQVNAITKAEQVAVEEFKGIVQSYDEAGIVNQYHSLKRVGDQWQIHYQGYATRFFGVDVHKIQDAKEG